MAKQPSVPAKTSGGSVPAYLQQFQGKTGMNSMDSTDVVVPRVKLLQALSPELEAYPGKAKPGIFWHNVLDESLGENFEFIVVADKKKYILFAPREDGQGILARAEDGKTWNPQRGKFQVKMKGVKSLIEWDIKSPLVAESGLTAFGTSNPEDPDSPPAATLIYEYLTILPERLDIGPVLMSCTRSQIRVAKRQLNSKLQMSKYPMQSMIFRAGIVKDGTPGNEYYNYSFTAAGLADEPLYQRTMDVAEQFKNYTVADEASIGAEAAMTGGKNETVSRSPSAVNTSGKARAGRAF